MIEGTKSVRELLGSDFDVLWLAGTDRFLEQNELILKKRRIEIVSASEEELGTAGSFQTNDGALALARMKPNAALSLTEDEYAIVLDDIRDPGNLGTIIRTADWYGVEHIIASEQTADFYNSKVLSATMGSFCRVKIYYTDLEAYLATARMPIYGTFLEGTDIHQVRFEKGGMIVIGNEANGISHTIEKIVTQKITIPRYGKAESLNAAIATGIILDAVRSKK